MTPNNIPLFKNYSHKQLNNHLKRFTELTSLRLLSEKAMQNIVYDLLFIQAYPDQKDHWLKAEKLLQQIALHLKKHLMKKNGAFINSGLPFAISEVIFSLDCLLWLKQHSDVKIIDSNLQCPEYLLNSILKLTLNTVEQAETSAGLTNHDLLYTLGITDKNLLPFLLSEFSRIHASPLIKDYLFEQLSLSAKLKPVNKLFSIPFNRFQLGDLFYHDKLLKKFDHQVLIDQKLPDETKLDLHQVQQLVKVIKNTMALTNRETDTVTYMDEQTLKYFSLERGIAVALYGMVSERQLPFESYIGYTLFKNGYPCAYGGSWIFGKKALFGINIFDWFRGGESGYVLCQLLRTFRQQFGVTCFEVEPYQYGLDNPDGIKSGAFWFYYRFGFRPVDKKLNSIATAEHQKLIKNKNYKCPYATLKKFTQSNIVLELEKPHSYSVSKLQSRISKMMKLKFKGNRVEAEKQCIKNFKIKSGIRDTTKVNEMLLTEIALWCEAFQINQNDQIKLMIEMLQIKPYNPYEYQDLLIRFFETGAD
jgi:hypothetical protein